MQTGRGATEDIPLSLPPDEISVAEVRLALETILISQPFRTSKQCQNLLRYIVEHSLSRDDMALRERVLGVEVFGRAADYDTSEDPVVRMRAADVRKRLAQYYQSIDDDASTIYIDLKPGSYRATFHLGRSSHPPITPAQGPSLPLPASPPPMVTGSPLPDQLPDNSLFTLAAVTKPHRSHSRRFPLLRLFFSAAALLSLIGLAAWLLEAPHWNSPQRRFWAPLTTSRKPILLYLGSNVAYRFTPEFQARYQKEHGLLANGPEFFVDLPPNGTVQTSDLVPMPSTFVTVGDLAASAQIVSLLNGWGKPFVLRSASDLSIGDLRNTPAVLIGGFNNHWTLETTDDLRFFFNNGTEIRDREHPDRIWKIIQEAHGITTEDYALVSRLSQAKTGGPAITVSGIGSYGTQAAAEFVTSDDKMSAMLRDAPAGWEQKNFQVVLRIRVLAFAPVAVEVVTTTWW